MSNPFVAEIRIFAGNFAPTGWAQCNGQLMQISQNTALFSLLGTTYGGDGKSNFALPNLQDSAAMHAGGAQPGPGLSFRDLGEQGGEQTVTLLQTEMAQHTHTFGGAVAANGNSQTPQGNIWAQAQFNRAALQAYSTPATGQVNPNAMPLAGGNLPH